MWHVVMLYVACLTITSLCNILLCRERVYTWVCRSNFPALAVRPLYFVTVCLRFQARGTELAPHFHSYSTNFVLLHLSLTQATPDIATI